MAHIGSVFLGDTKRHRLLSSSTPPSSPPPHMSFGGHPSPVVHSPGPASPNSAHMDGGHSNLKDIVFPKPDKIKATTIDPVMSLELRLRLLEAIVLGVKSGTLKGKASEETLARAVEHVQRNLDAIVEQNDGLKRFMNHYDQHAHLLTPSFALAGVLPDPPAYENMSTEELEVFLAEMENDIRAADRDMREIEALDRKGVTGAGKLADYEALQPRLQALLKDHEDSVQRATKLEKRIALIMDKHATQVDALSELFVAWDDAITEAEDKVSKLERDREERQRLGFE